MDDQGTNRESSGVTIVPRFGIRALLILFGVVALWLASYQIPAWTSPGPGRDVRAILFFAIWFASGVAAIYYRGKRQAFWGGFFVSMFLLKGKVSPFAPDLASIGADWRVGMVRNYRLSNTAQLMFEDAVSAGLLLCASVLCGVLTASIYVRSRAQK
jgi:hypothetical protein